MADWNPEDSPNDTVSSEHSFSGAVSSMRSFVEALSQLDFLDMAPRKEPEVIARPLTPDDKYEILKRELIPLLGRSNLENWYCSPDRELNFQLPDVELLGMKIKGLYGKIWVDDGYYKFKVYQDDTCYPIHPHKFGSMICLGGNEDIIYDRLNEFNFGGALAQMMVAVSSVNVYDAPGLEPRSYECAYCGAEYDQDWDDEEIPDQITSCESCYEEICESCQKWCEECGRSLCSYCYGNPDEFEFDPWRLLIYSPDICERCAEDFEPELPPINTRRRLMVWRYIQQLKKKRRIGVPFKFRRSEMVHQAQSILYELGL